MEPFVVRIHAVDKDGKSVPEAKVAVYQGRRINAPRVRIPRAGGNTYSGPLHGKKPVWLGLTDPNGRCKMELNLEMSYLEVSKEDVGSTGHLAIWHSRPRKGEWMVSLEPEILLEGQVLRADGTPAAGVDVRIGVQGHSTARRFARTRPQPQKTDLDGRFTERLQPGTIYAVRASDGKERAHPVRVHTTGSGPKVHKVTVHFPGAISVRGLLLGPHGKPVQGRVRVYEKLTMEEIRARRDSPYSRSAKTDAHGKFRLDLPRHASYQLLGSAEDHAASPLTDVMLTKARPHADVNVQLVAPSSIAGTVRHAEGKPAVHTWVYIRAESGEQRPFAGVPLSTDLYGRYKPADTDEQGRFAFDAVHPGTKYTLICRPDRARREIQIVRRGVEAGTTSLEVVIRPEDLLTAKIIATIRRDDTGELVKNFEVRRFRYDLDGKLRGVSGQWEHVYDEKGRYTLSDLAMNKKCAIVVRAEDLAPRQFGPIVTTKAEQEVVVRLLKRGSVVVQVNDDAGKPAVNIRVNIVPVIRIPGTGWKGPMQSDSKGRCLFRYMTPGQYDVSTWRDGKLSKKQRVEVRPGQESQVTVGLPK